MFALKELCKHFKHDFYKLLSLSVGNIKNNNLQEMSFKKRLTA